MARGRRGNRKNAVTNVRISDSIQGADGLKFDRVLGQLQNSHSQVRILCNLSYSLPVSTSGGDASTASTGVNIRASDDFISMAQQFETYRIKMVRYDIYDINQSISAYSMFSTFHDENSTYPPPATFQQVIDSPDSTTVPPGMGKVSLLWTAKGSTENQFQTTLTNGNVTPVDFGGLRGVIGTGTSAGSKFMIVAKAIVDFRGRI